MTSNKETENVNNERHGLVLSRERMIIALSLLAMTSLSWAYLWFDAVRMGAMHMNSGDMAENAMNMPPAGSPWGVHALLTFVMWSIMMVGMMLPSALPAITLYGAMTRKKQATDSVFPSVWAFTGGYLAVWTVFSAAATILQTGLNSVGLLTSMLVSNSYWLSGSLLIIAGIYQWLPIKDVCLQKCRAPLQYFLFHWRPGNAGAFRMGLEHGAFCVGCCWAIMLLLFAAGVMNLMWVAIIAGFTLVEKLLPGGVLVGRITGIVLATLGLGLIAENIF